MSLFAVNVPNTDFAKVHKLLYGFPKIGKTRFAYTMRDTAGKPPLFIMTEDGLGSLAAHHCRIKTGWEGFIKAVEYIVANKDQIRLDHSCIILDHMTDLDAWCSTYVAKMKNVEYIGDLEQGKGWKLLREQFQKPLHALMEVLPCVFIAHAQDKRLKWEGAEEMVPMQAPSMGKAALEFINGKVEAIMFVLPADNKHLYPRITMWPSVSYVAGCRQRRVCKTYDYDPAAPEGTWAKIATEYLLAQKEDAAKGVDTSKNAVVPETTAQPTAQ